MNEKEMRDGFARGRSLTQEEWSSKAEIELVDKLIAEGVCKVVRPWSYSDNFQCEYRIVRGAQTDGWE